MSTVAPSSWHVYILKCGDGTYYTGATNNLAARVSKHQAGTGAKYTRGRAPVILVYSELHSDKSAALKREYQLKQLNHAEKRSIIARENL